MNFGMKSKRKDRQVNKTNKERTEPVGRQIHNNIKRDKWRLVGTDLWILQAAFPTVTSCLFPASRKVPLMVSMVFPDLGPNVGKISWITGFWAQRQNQTLQKLCVVFKHSSENVSVFEFLTTNVKPSILATLWPDMTLTACPEGVKFPLNTGEHCISVHLNKNPPRHTHKQIIILCHSHPAFILIQWSSTTLQECTEKQSSSGTGKAVFLFL